MNASPSPYSPAEDAAFAAELAQEAGKLLLRLRSEITDPAERRTAGDAEANVVILDRLATDRPDDAVLSEESADNLDRLDYERVWIIDPLDGTREFGEDGRDDWAVHVALAINGVASVGAVALPALNTVYVTHPAPVLPERDAGPVRLVVSRTRPPEITEALRVELDAELVPMGSAGAKTMAILRGEVDIYAHAGGQYQWDSAAPVAVAAAAGLHVSRLDGSPLVYNAAERALPDLLICRPEHADLIIHVANS